MDIEYRLKIKIIYKLTSIFNNTEQVDLLVLEFRSNLVRYLRSDIATKISTIKVLL